MTLSLFGSSSRWVRVSRVFSFLVGLGCVAPWIPTTARADLIAAESFKATASGTGGTYDADVNLGNSPNLSVVAGNSGFAAGAGKQWGNNTAGVVANLSGLSHPLVSGVAESGGVRVGNLTAGISRRVYRPFATTPAAADSYFFSGLVNLPTLTSLNGASQSLAGVTRATGTAQDTFDIAGGIHFGLAKNASNEIDLVVAAGGGFYPLLRLTEANVTYQVVLRLDVSVSGADTLSAWYAAAGDEDLIQGLEATGVGDIFQTPANLGALLIQTRNQSGNNNSGRTVLFDELRFGTTLGDVTTGSIPEPASAALFVALAAAGAACRRRARERG